MKKTHPYLTVFSVSISATLHYSLLKTNQTHPPRKTKHEFS
jgi:hypothetical protein